MTADLEFAAPLPPKTRVRRYLFALVLSGLAVYFFLPRFAAMGHAFLVISPPDWCLRPLVRSLEQRTNEAPQRSIISKVCASFRALQIVSRNCASAAGWDPHNLHRTTGMADDCL
jgi:hypothetical protein